MKKTLKKPKLTKEQAEKLTDDLENDKLKFKYGIKNKYEALYEGMERQNLTQKHKEEVMKSYHDPNEARDNVDKELAGKILDLFFVGKYKSEVIVGTVKEVHLLVTAEAYEHALEYDVEQIKKTEKWK